MENLKRSADIDSNDERQNNKRQKIEDQTDLGSKQEEVINLIKREFHNEITKRQEEVHIIQQRLLKAQKTLHLLKYVIIKSFYDRKELKNTTKEESVVNYNGKLLDNTYTSTGIESRLHPAVKKLVGKKPVDYNIFHTRNQENNLTPIKTEPVDEIETQSEENETPNNQQEPTESEVKVPIRNRQKIKHEIIVGNISKYVPSCNSQDSSTHKWMVYVRGPRDKPDISHLVKKVRFFLHPSYQPNDIIELEESPFHLSRRGWGEFPLRIQMHFHANLNKPVDVIHNLKLDQNRTGRQTLGNETLVNVWLYDKSATEDIDLENKIDNNKIKQEIVEDNISNLSNLNSEPSCSTDIQVKLEPNDENTIEQPSIDTNNILNQKPAIAKKLKTKKNISLLKTTLLKSFRNKLLESKLENNNLKSILKEQTQKDYDLVYLVDHCYTNLKNESEEIIDREKYKLKIPLENFTCIKQIVYYLFKSLPLVSELAEDPSYKCCYPYVASTFEQFSSWNYAKRCCSEWFRARHIKKLLQDYKITNEEDWTIKFIIMFGRAHAFTPNTNYEIFQNRNESGKTVPNQMLVSETTSTLSEYIPVGKLMESKNPHKTDEENCFVDVESLTNDIPEEKVRTTNVPISTETDPEIFPICNYIKKCAAEIEIKLEDEEIEDGVWHNSAERVLLQSVKCLAEELIRKAWANKVIDQRGKNLNCAIERNDIYRVLLEREEFDILTNEGLGKAVT